MKTNFIVICKSAWPYGLILGAISIVISLLLYIFNVNMFSIGFGIFSLLVFMIALPVTMGILGGNSLRLKHKEDRTISYLDTVVTCAIIFLIGFLLSNLYNYVFNNFIDPEYIKSQMPKLVEMLENMNVPQDAIDKAVADTENKMGILYQLRSSLIFTVVLSFLVALVIRKKDKFDEKIV